MLVDYISDLHMELNSNVRLTKQKGGDVLILAGDITCMRFFHPNRTDAESRGMKKRFKSLLWETFADYKKIYYLPGNHEYYGHHFVKADDRFKDIIESYDPRLEFVNNVSKFYSDDDRHVMFIFSTLWTDFDNANPLCLHACRDMINDYKTIHLHHDKDLDYTKTKSPWFNQNKLSPEYILTTNRDYVNYIKLAYEHAVGATDIVVATHHAPSYQSHNPTRFGPADASTSAFCAELGNWIAETNIKYWIHGHTHSDVNYHIGDCNVLGCMYGYDGYEFPSSTRPKEIGRINLC